MTEHFDLTIAGDPTPLHEKVIRTALAKYPYADRPLHSSRKNAGWRKFDGEDDSAGLDLQQEGRWEQKDWGFGFS